MCSDKANYLGISIVGQSNKGGDGGIYVGSIMKGGAVALDGRIEPGDMILEVNGVSFENLSNDDAVRTLRESVAQQTEPITLVVAKCWDPNPRRFAAPPPARPPLEPVRPIDPSAWVLHTEAARGGGWAGGQGGAGGWGRMGPPSMSAMTSTCSSSLISSVPPPGVCDYGRRPPQQQQQQASNTSSSSAHSSSRAGGGGGGSELVTLTRQSDMQAVVRAMAQPDSGLEVRDRMWLKIHIPHAFIGTSSSSSFSSFPHIS